jgi:heme exporter protein A
LAFSIELQGVGKTFGETTALRSFSATVQEGERIGVIGHNGAGKSTLLNIIATLVRPSSGKIDFRLDGETLSNANQIRRQLSYLSHEPMLYGDLTAAENLRFVAQMYGRELDEQSLMDVLREVGMETARDRLFRNCSRGMKQRLSLARALLADPRLLLLDEPFSGLDTEGVARLRSLFSTATRSWIMVTHHLHLGYALATRFWILKRGRLLHDLHKVDIDFETYLELCGATPEAVPQ